MGSGITRRQSPIATCPRGPTAQASFYQAVSKNLYATPNGHTEEVQYQRSASALQ